MKKCLFAGLMIMIMLLTACSTRIYGVPEDRWQTMSEQERIAAMEAYKARQEVLRQQRAERARLRALEKQAQLEREAEEARQRQLEIDAIYRGEGVYGDLLRVNLEGGRLKFRGIHRPYQPLSFKIAAQETKDIEIVSSDGRREHLTVLYDGSNLLLDETRKSRRSKALRLPFEKAWEEGTTYPNLSAKGPHKLQGVNVSIQIVGQPPRGRHGRRHVSRDAAPRPSRDRQGPDVIVIKERAPKTKPVVVVVDSPRQERVPEIIVVNPRSDEGQQGRTTEHRSGQTRRVPASNDREPPSKPVVVVVENRPQEKGPDAVVVRAQPEKDRHRKTITHRSPQESKASAPPAQIKVVFRSGQLKVNRHSYPLKPLTIQLRDGQVRNVTVRSGQGKLKIRLSYIDGQLLINDSPGKNGKSTRISHARGWKAGQSYMIAASEGRKLEDLDMLVVAQ